MGRLARIGQGEKQVSVQLFFVGNTIEQRILQLRLPTGLADSQVLVSDDGATVPIEQFLRQNSEDRTRHLITYDHTLSLLGNNSDNAF